MDGLHWSEKEKEVIQTAVDQLAESLRTDRPFEKESHELQRHLLIELFWENSARQIQENEHTPLTAMPPETVLLYELHTLYDLAEQFNDNL